MARRTEDIIKSTKPGRRQTLHKNLNGGNDSETSRPLLRPPFLSAQDDRSTTPTRCFTRIYHERPGHDRDYDTTDDDEHAYTYTYTTSWTSRVPSYRWIQGVLPFLRYHVRGKSAQFSLPSPLTNKDMTCLDHRNRGQKLTFHS